MKPCEGMLVVLAEDDYLVAQETKRVLSKIGCNVLAIAGNGEEAIERTTALNPDVVIMDISMPVMDGLEASRRIAQGVGVPIVVLSAHEESTLVKEAVDSGVGAYLTKPVDPALAARAIHIAVARNKDLQDLRKINQRLREVMKEMVTLREIIPICAQCRKIRDDDGYWIQVEEYFSKYTSTQVSHGLCESCARKLYPDMADRLLDKKKPAKDLDIDQGW